MLRALISIILLVGLSAALCAADNSQCLMCHSAKGLSKEGRDGRQISLYVDPAEYRASTHGNRACTDCHTDLKETAYPHKSDLQRVQCSSCHRMGNGVGAPDHSPQAEYIDSVHGLAVARGDKDAPGCRDCHGAHDIRAISDPKSRVHRANIPATCATCHSDQKLVERHGIPDKKPTIKYEKSVHGRAIEQQGLLAAAVCTDCHGAHDIRRSADPMSSVNKPHIPETCGQCHQKIYQQYEEGIHGKAIRQGRMDAPVCTDCHGEHTIMSLSEESSSVYPTHIRATCSKCHEDETIESKYGLPGKRVSSYVGSYHGIANKFGDTTVANCATCHEAHRILPSSDPTSSIHKANLPETCGKCHPGAGINFARGSIHVTPSKDKDIGVYWVRRFYSLFIFGLIGSFCVYIALDLRYRFSKWRRERRAPGRED